MDLNKLELAKEEAKRFLSRCTELECYLVDNPYMTYDECARGSKFTGSVKRSSMDLTRSLAELRKG